MKKLSGIFPNVFISTKEPAAFATLRVPVIRDEANEYAPIFGLRAALAQLDAPIFALAVDLPAIPVRLIRAMTRAFLTGRHECLAPRVEGKIQGLCALYRPSTLPSFDHQIEKKHFAIHELVAKLRSEIWEEARWRRFAGPSAFVNLNRREDYEVFNARKVRRPGTTRKGGGKNARRRGNRPGF